MSVSFENTATNRGVVTFTIGQDKIQPALDQAFNKVKKNLNAPGFRKGHMPRAVFNQKFGEEALYDDALNAILPAAYEAAIAELGLDVVAQPKIDVKSIGKGQDWTLTAEVVTKPEVKLGAYKDLEVSVEVSKEVTDEEVDAKLENERKNLAELIVKDGAAEYGDTVVIDFVGSVDGVEFDGGKGENHSLELGSGQFIPGFEDQLVGAKSGDEVEVKIVKIDEESEKVSLSKKELEDSPIQKYAKSHENGDIVHGKIRDIKEFGIFVELEDNVDALIRKEDLGQVNEADLKIGDEIEAAITFIDDKKNRIRLSVRRLSKLKEREALKEINKEEKMTLGDILKDQLK